VSTTATVGSFAETFASGAFAATTSVTLCYIPQTKLPAPLVRFVHVDKAGNRQPDFTAGSGNTYVTAFATSFNGATLRGSAVVSGTGIVPTTIVSGTVLNIAVNQSGTWVDVGTALVGANGSFQSTIPTTSLPGLTTAGNYLVYLPPSGSTTQVNLGFAIIADDGSASPDGLQFVQIENTQGRALPTPTTTYFPISAGDLDGEGLTPDAQRGAVVDGGSSVYFFSGIPQHKFVLSPTTADVSSYGGDGDSIASLPNGDEAVVTGDNGAPFAVLSGILSGNPVIADSVLTSGNSFDGLVISNDGTTLLARGFAGIDVIKITASPPHKGSTGMGTVSHTYVDIKSLTGIPTPYFEDGRDGMAFSPTDSSRAVFAGQDPTSGNPTLSLITGLPSSATVQSLHLKPMYGVVRRDVRRKAEPSFRRKPFSTTVPSGDIFAVTISPNGKIAYVSTTAGIFTFGGVDTGTLAQIGTPYTPVLTVPASGGGTQPCALGSSSGITAPSIGILPDGKYLVATVDCGLAPNGTTQLGTGVLITIPIASNGSLGAPVGQLNYIVTPFNDQIIVH
jgi:hypothetical protein